MTTIKPMIKSVAAVKKVVAPCSMTPDIFPQIFFTWHLLQYPLSRSGTLFISI